MRSSRRQAGSENNHAYVMASTVRCPAAASFLAWHGVHRTDLHFRWTASPIMTTFGRMNRKDAKAQRERGPGHRQLQPFFAPSRLCGSNSPSASRWTGQRVVLRLFPAGHGVHRSDSPRHWKTRGTWLLATTLSSQIKPLPLVIPAKAGTQRLQSALPLLGPRFRGDDTVRLRRFRAKARCPMHPFGTLEAHSPV